MYDIDTADLKAHAPLIPYIQNHYKNKIIPEKRTKGTVFCKCLWHQEDTPSLAFFENGTYKCFGCGAHGDVISLVRSIEGVGFEEACKIIADNVNYPLIMRNINPAHEIYKDKLDEFNRRYWANLQNNSTALNYVMNVRGINANMIDLYRLGFTDSEEYKYRTDIGNISSKLVFPILEHRRRKAKCVGMAYRTLGNDKPKYLNDPNQEGKQGQDNALINVFIKGNMLYGLPQAYEGISKFRYAIIVEGYFDVISLYQSGLTNAVSTMGTNITMAQLDALKKITDNVLICYDGDNAGIEATSKNIKKLLEYGFNVAVCSLSAGQDPADLCKSLDFNYFKVNDAIKEHTTQGIEFIVSRIVQHYESIVIKERIKAVKEGLSFIECIKDPSMKEVFKNYLNKRLDI